MLKNTEDKGEESPLLYCELIQKTRFGRSYLIKNQGCTVGAYVLGKIDTPPVDYYYNSKRYKDRSTAELAVLSLHRFSRQSSIKIAPYTGEDFDVF